MEGGILMLCVLYLCWEIPAQNLKDDKALRLGWSMVLSRGGDDAVVGIHSQSCGCHNHILFLSFSLIVQTNQEKETNL
jgi:hypothetical protein